MTRSISIREITDFVNAILRANDVPAAVAEDVADVLVNAEAKGFGSHGVMRLGRVLTGIKSGTHFPNADPDFKLVTPCALHVDGHHQLGPHVSTVVTDKLIEMAETYGLAMASIHNMTHFGTGGYYTERMAASGLLGLVFCNTQPASSPFGGKGKVLGTNPVSFSSAQSSGQIITVDMATTAAARGKLIAAELADETIADYLAVDENGVMTNDPTAGLGGALLPLGGPFGYKGTGLSIMIDILSGALSGAQTSKQVSGTATTTDSCTAGYFMLAIDPKVFAGQDIFDLRLDQLVADIQSAGPDVMLPGEREAKNLKSAETAGLKLNPALLNEMKNWAKESGVDYPF